MFLFPILLRASASYIALSLSMFMGSEVLHRVLRLSAQDASRSRIDMEMEHETQTDNVTTTSFYFTTITTFIHGSAVQSLCFR
jgi:hypothetical protein